MASLGCTFRGYLGTRPPSACSEMLAFNGRISQLHAGTRRYIYFLLLGTRRLHEASWTQSTQKKSFIRNRPARHECGFVHDRGREAACCDMASATAADWPRERSTAPRNATRYERNPKLLARLLRNR
eukprot:6181649-Pleurochrysis_carterae.AAC.3